RRDVDECVEQRRLAGNVGADDAEDLLLLDVERDVLQGVEAAELLVDAHDAEDRAHAARSFRRSPRPMLTSAPPMPRGWRMTNRMRRAPKTMSPTATRLPVNWLLVISS